MSTSSPFSLCIPVGGDRLGEFRLDDAYSSSTGRSLKTRPSR